MCLSPLSQWYLGVVYSNRLTSFFIVVLTWHGLPRTLNAFFLSISCLFNKIMDVGSSIKSSSYVHIEVNHCYWGSLFEARFFSSFLLISRFDLLHVTGEGSKTQVILLPPFGRSMLFVFATFVCVFMFLGDVFWLDIDFLLLFLIFPFQVIFLFIKFSKDSLSFFWLYIFNITCNLHTELCAQVEQTNT